CTKLQQRVLDLENTKTTQQKEINSLKRRVKKLEQKKRLRTPKLKRLYKGRIADIDADAGVTLDSTHFVVDIDMFGVHDLDGDEVIIDNVDVVKTAKETRSVVEEVTVVIEKAKLVSATKETVNAAATTVSTASTILVKLKSAKPKADKVVIQEPEQGTTTTTPTTKPIAKGIAFREPGKSTITTISSKDKGKGIMVEEPAKMKKKDQISFNKQEAKRLQAEFDEEERLAREKDEANVALTKE
ncbi:hypothetical protein Tco_1387918, partial [Tanacetum coccineum]